VPRKKKPSEKKMSLDTNDPKIDDEQAMAGEIDRLDVLPLQDASSADTAFFSAASFSDGDSDTCAEDRGFL